MFIVYPNNLSKAGRVYSLYFEVCQDVIFSYKAKEMHKYSNLTFKLYTFNVDFLHELQGKERAEKINHLTIVRVLAVI